MSTNLNPVIADALAPFAPAPIPFPREGSPTPITKSLAQSLARVRLQELNGNVTGKRESLLALRDRLHHILAQLERGEL